MQAIKEILGVSVEGGHFCCLLKVNFFKGSYNMGVWGCLCTKLTKVWVLV